MTKPIEIDRTSPIPAYYQIARDLRNRIIRHEWLTNERVPPELELAERYGVSRITIRQAMAELEKDGLLVRMRGRGTFVCGDPTPYVNDLSYSIVSGDRITQAYSVTAKILEKRVVTDLFPAVSENLKLAPSDHAVYIKRLFFLKGKPFAIGQSHIPAKLAPGLEDEPMVNNSISITLAQNYNCHVSRVEDYIEAVRSTQSECNLLKCAYDAPLILIRGVSYLDSGEALEYSSTFWSGDTVRLHITLKHNESGFSVEP